MPMPSARSSAIILGISSPSTMCRKEIMENATMIASNVCDICGRACRGDARSNRLQQGHEGRLTQPSQRERRDRDSELRGIDEKRWIVQQAQRRRGSATAGRGPSLETRSSDGDQRKFGADEIPVYQYTKAELPGA